MTRTEILAKADDIITGQREQDYGTPENNFSVIAVLWNAYNEAIQYRPYRPDDVAVMMCLFKIARIATGVGTMDSYVDLCGYAACGGEINSKLEENK